MAARMIYLLWGSEGSQQPVWFVEGSKGEIVESTGTLDELQYQYPLAQMTLLVPARDLLHTDIHLPTRKRSQMIQALPFAMEDQVGSDIDTLHFALGALTTGGEAAVHVVSRDRMDQWSDAAKGINLRLLRICSDLYLVPYREGEWSLLIQGERTLIRTAADQGSELATSALQILLQDLYEVTNKDKRPERIVIYSTDSGGEFLTPVFADTEVEYHPISSIREVMTPASLKSLGRSINLLQGEYGQNQRLGKIVGPWRFAAMLLLLISLFYAADWLLIHQQRQELDQKLANAVEELYRQTFPDARHIVNPRVQMERHLQSLSQPSQQNGFSRLLVRIAQPLKDLSGAKIDNLRYRPGEISLNLTLKGLPQLDQLKQKLKLVGVDATIDSASSRDGKVIGRITVRAGTGEAS